MSFKPATATSLCPFPDLGVAVSVSKFETGGGAMFFSSTKSMIGTLGVASILMLSGSIHAQNSVSKGQPAAVTILDSTKEQDGLTGSVRRVRTESAKLELQGARLVEGPRQLLEITTYGPRGNRAENVSYPSASSLVGKEEYKYDDKGNIVEMTLRDEGGMILSREAYDYEFDRFGNWTRMVTNLFVFEGGTLKHEPIEVTYRTITYYFDDQIAKIVEPASRQKMPEIPAATGLKVSNMVALANGPTTISNTPGAPIVPGLEPPPELTKPAEAERASAPARSDSEPPSGSSVLGAQPTPGLTKSVEAEKTSAPTPDDREQSSGFSVLFAHPEPELTKPAEAEKTSAPAPNDSEPSSGSRVQPSLLTSSTTSANTAASEEARVAVPPKNAPPKEVPASTKGLEYFKAGRNLFESGDLKGAVAAYLQSIELQPDSAEVHLSLGLAYLKLEKNKDAAKAFKDSVRLQPDVAEAQYGLGLAYFRISRHKDAADAFKRATILRPDMAKAHYGLALAYQELGKTDALIAEFRILQTLDANLAKKLAQAFPESNLPCNSKCK
jgi:Flp pilus assembly protein TadD